MPSLQVILDDLLNRHYTDSTPGAVLLIARGDNVLYQNGAGLADMGTGANLTPGTTFRLASVSKQFTATCILLLAEKGLLRLDDRLDLYFPELSHIGKVRLYHLLNHSSGLPDFEEKIPADQATQLTDEDVLHLTIVQQKLLFPPGTMFRYSNTAYVLLGLLVERVTGQDYADFLQENIFRPLQMCTTTLYNAATHIPHRAIGYAQQQARDFILSDQNVGTATRGDGCIYTSAEDYLKWHQALSGNGILNIKKALHTYPTEINGSKRWYYNMGWFFERRSGGQEEYFHSGDTSGFTNLVMRLPQHNTLILCFSNIANNQIFLEELLNTLEQYPELSPRSNLVRKLPHLTR